MDIEIIYDLVITPANQIVAAGIAFNGSPGFVSQFALARYNNDGSLDVHFDGDGKVLTDVTTSDDGAQGVVLQADGKILAAGGVAGARWARPATTATAVSTPATACTAWRSSARVR
ncbi:MAG: hypothetical protein JWN04_2592 [Myxococcaceae bacterium]|nr:hypothetical protein [Myxococcaceae bacterium]